MFQRTAWPNLRSRQCRDALVDHVKEYYELVTEIVSSAFTAEQRRCGDHIDLLSYQISRISSPVEVGPAAKLLAESTFTQDELSLLSGRLAASIDRIESDDRSVSASLGAADEALHQLARNLDFRWELFNGANHPQFGLPASTIGVGGVGTITSAQRANRQMQLALRLSF